MAALAAEQTSQWTAAAMAARIVRYGELKPCYNAFIDTRSPGSETKENFTIIGPGVSENPDQHVHIAEPHGFNIGGARQPPGCVNSQHSHDTAEVFVVHSGQWRFTLGEHGTDAMVECGPGDVISLPTGMFRGFTNIGDDIGFLFAILGGDDPGHVLWAPYVFDMAKDYGLVLLASGELVDTAAGQPLPEGARLMPRTTAAQVAALHVPDSAAAEALVWRASGADGASVQGLIGPHAPLGADQGFLLERLAITAGGKLDLARASTPEVLFVHDGAVDLVWDGAAVTLLSGDTMTVPIGLDRRLVSETGAIIYRVLG